MTTKQTCSHCDGQGYVEIRDCTGDIQREETCMLCGGNGKRETQNNVRSERESCQSELRNLKILWAN